MLVEAGVVGPMRPDQLIAVGSALRRWGASPAAGITSAAARRRDDIGVIDERGGVSFGELDRDSNALARALRAEGVGAGDAVAVMCRNHRGFVDAIFACAKLGATVLLMNTDFAGPQLEGVIEREQPKALIYDSEFSELLAGAGQDLLPDRRLGRRRRQPPIDADRDRADRARARQEPLDPPADPEPLRRSSPPAPPAPRRGPSAARPDSLGPLAVLLSKIPLRSERTIAHRRPDVPLLGLPALHPRAGAGQHLRPAPPVHARRGRCRRSSEHRADALAVVPVMLQRIMELPEENRAGYDLSSLRVTAASGSALPGDLATRWMDAFGDNLYNLYGSTEVAWASIATPADMRAAPGHGRTGRRTARSSGSSTSDGQRGARRGETGRIFVGNEMAFEGYTGGGGKEDLDGLLSSGDVGHFDSEGRLFIDGRDDEMIVSGGENVFPREVEDLLSDHEAIDEAAVIGVDDEKFGQRLKAFVVVADGDELSEDEVKDYIKAEPRPLQGAARGRVPLASCPATRPARSSSASLPEPAASRPAPEPAVSLAR